jgi:DNA polymerase-3 subunit alpha
MEESWDYNVPMTLFGRQEVGQRLRAAGVDNRLLVSQALDTTVEIADRCNVALTKMPRVIFPLPKGVGSAEDLLWQELRNGWRYRDMDHHLARDMTREDYASRLKMEMGLIVDKGFVDYFLVLGDIIRWAKGRGIVVGPARGSAGASLVSYMLRITEIDPLEYAQMYFERFIDPNRTDLPDIDLDFDDERRDEIRKYAIDKYGMDHVGNIGTFTKYKGKNALDDVARVTRVPLPEVTRLKEFVIERSSGDSRYSKTLEDTMDQFPLARAVMERNPSLSKAFELEGMLKSMGIHAAGLVISDKPLTDVCAIYTREVNNAFRGKRKVSVLSVDKYDGEYLGMMKIDTLGLTTLGMIRICLEMTGMTLEQLYALPFNDERVIDAFRRCDVKGIFQYEGRTTKSIVAQLKPDNFQELIDINALSRPGPYHSGTTLNYINEKWGHWDKNAEVNKWTQNEVVKSICGYTKDQMIYQEQMLAICREMGNLPWVKLGEIRKIISLKYGEAAFLSHMKAFLEGAVANGHDPAEAENIFRHMITAGQYAFNLAHSVAYSMLGYWSMYFKVYHPEAFYAASLRKADKAKWAFLMRDMIDEHFAGLRGDGRDITVGPLDINKSDITWTTGHGVITPGFAQVPGIGYKLAAGIVWERNTAEKLGQGWDWPDIRLVSGIGPAKFEAIQGWAKATDPFGVSTLRLKLNEVRVMLRAGYLVDNGGRMLPAPSHKSEDLPYDMGVSFTDAKGNPTWGREGALPVTWIGRVRGRNLRDLFEEHRSREGSDLDPTTIKEPNKKLSMVLYAYDDTDEINVRVSRWKYEGMKDLLMQMKLDHDIIVVDGYKTKSFGRKIEADRMWLIDPD